MSKCAVKKSKLPKAENLLHEIEQKVKMFNALYPVSEMDEIHLVSNSMEITKRLKAYEYGIQFGNDVTMIVLHEYFGFADERCKKLFDGFNAVYPEFRELAFKDHKDDPDMEYFWAKLDERLKAACGKYYDPKERRYYCLINRGGDVIGEMTYKDIAELFKIDAKDVRYP